MPLMRRSGKQRIKVNNRYNFPSLPFSQLTVFNFKAKELDFVSLMLGLLLQATGARGQLVLLLARLGTHIKGQLGNRSHVVDGAAKLVQLLAYVVQLPGIGGQIVAIALAGFAAVL